jgi:2'-5' RNA ligase
VNAFRLFVALSLPNRVKAELENAQSEFRRAVPGHGIRWAKPEQFHLTLRFLGSVLPSQMDPLSEALQSACSRFAPLRLRAESIGFFPDAHRVRVIWAGIRDATFNLVQLQEAVASAAAAFTSEPAEKTFAGHVTLGRSRELSKTEALELARLGAAMVSRQFGEWTAETIELMRSELTSAGARYSVLAEIRLPVVL